MTSLQDKAMDIITAAWMQAEDETNVFPGKEFRLKFFGLLENEAIALGLFKCDDPYCKADHTKRINKKWLMS